MHSCKEICIAMGISEETGLAKRCLVVEFKGWDGGKGAGFGVKESENYNND